MEYIHHELTGLDAGDVIRVELSGTEANVRLLDTANYRSYAAGGTHRYIGGHYRRSPVIFRAPSPGTWHVVVDLGGYRGRVGSRVSVISRGVTV